MTDRMKSDRNGKLQLPQVTLAAMTSVNIRATVKALQYSMRGIDFGDVVLISHRRPAFLPKGIRYAHIDRLSEINQFNYNMVYELYRYVNTEFCLTVHADGFVVHPECWRDEFLDYDYIGSPWPDPHDDFTYRDKDGVLIRVGNSVGIRSKRLLEFPVKAGIPFEADHGFFNEDGFICVKNRHLFTEAGMRFAPLETAVYFGHEHMIPEIQGITPFLFHKWEGTNADYPKFYNEADRIEDGIHRVLERHSKRSKR